MRIKKLAIAAAALVVATTMSLSGCSGSNGGSDDGPIKVGASLQLTGTWATSGIREQMMLKKAVADVNATGGIKVGDTKRKIDLKILDNRSDISTMTDQARTLILEDKVQALFGMCVTEDAAAVGLVAERYKIPFLSTCEPTTAFMQANKSGWKYGYGLYYNEQQQAENLVPALDLEKTNKKVAIFADNSQDGVTQTAAFTKALQAGGYTIAMKKSFPIGTTDFSASIKAAKNADADIALAIFTPPDAFALIRQFVALGYAPKITRFPKAGDGTNWSNSLKGMGDGTLGQGILLPDSAHDVVSYAETKFQQPDANLSSLWYGVAQVYEQAVEKAGTSDPEKVNSTIESTSFKTVIGPIKYNKGHVASVKMYVFQWQDQKAVQVYPKVEGNTFQFPNPTLNKSN